jgi:hypothetical protein
MAMRSSESSGDLEKAGAAAGKAREARLVRRPRAACALAVASTIAFALSVALVPQAADAAATRGARPAASPSLATAVPSANAAGWERPGLATLAGEPEVQSRRIGLALYCNGEAACRGWFTLVASGLRLVMYRWVGDRRVVTHVVHHLLLGAADFEIAPGGTDGVWLTLSARNRRVLTEAGGLPATLAGKDLTAARFEVNLPRRECRPLPPPVIEHGSERK